MTAPGANAVPTVDLGTWRSDPTAVAAQVDTALQRAGFLLVTGHGVDADLRAGVRAAARRFFALPDDVKRRYAVGAPRRDLRGLIPERSAGFPERPRGR